MNRSKTVFKAVGLIALLAIIVVGGWGAVQVSKVLGGGHKSAGGIGGDTPQGASSVPQEAKDLLEIWQNPYAGFPGQDRVVILGMGIDDNWTDKDELFTKGTRTDTLFLLTLYLKEHRATMLSIPRDTFTHIAGTSYSSKINSAYATGGPLRSVATVAELTGIRPDHYMVLNIDATKKMVDALGGVDVDVEHEMHYHDKWGHLSIDLYPGEQHLDGDKAVAFVRYRHPDPGAKPSPEDGDVRRTERQHVLMRAMIAQAKSFVNVSQIGSLINTGMEQIHTDLSRKQLAELAVIYKDMQPADMQTATLPGEDFHGPNGAWDYRLYPDQMKAYVDWLVRGNETAVRGLTPVIIQNGTSVPGLAARAADILRRQGYVNVRVDAGRTGVRLASDTTRPAVAVTQLLDTGVPDPNSAKDIATILNVPSAVDRREPNKPNRLGWTAPSAVTLVLGQDYAQQSPAGTVTQSADVAGANASPAVPVTNEPATTAQAASSRQ